MIWRIQLGKWRFTFSIAKITEVIGVNSLLPSGDHILMWDFDKKVQRQHNLPDIIILRTGKPKSYHAYCFARCTWNEAVRIVASTDHVDMSYFKYSVYRGKFTLRVSPKSGREVTYVTKLVGYRPSEVSVRELKSWVRYQTLDDATKRTYLDIFLPQLKIKRGTY